MNINIANIVAFGLTLTLVACSRPAQSGEQTQAEGEARPKASQTVSITPSPGQKVEVAKGGTEFNPAVPVSSIPNGSWACVMNDTVHYASSEKREGECTVCGMNLVQTGKDK